MEWLCPVCSGKYSKLVSKRSGLSIRRCSNCSLVYLDATHDPVDYFNKAETDFFGDKRLHQHDLFSERFLIHKAKQRMTVIQKLRSSGRLLDVGCGTGELIYVAGRLGYDAEGLEYSHTLVKYVRAHYNAIVYCGDVIDVDLHEKYDIVVMSHMLEHTINPLTSLQDISKLLSPGGILYVAIPNMDCWEASFAGWGAYEPYHLWYFNSANLRRLLEKVGYKIVKIHTWEPYSAWFNTIIRSLFMPERTTKRVAGHRGSDGRSRFLFIIQKILLNIFRFLFGFLITPFRKLQEKASKGEELIEIAFWGKR